MWIGKKKLREHEDKAYDSGLAIGYGLGFQMGMIEARNRMLNPKSFVEKQIEIILEQKKDDSN